MRRLCLSVGLGALIACGVTAQTIQAKIDSAIATAKTCTGQRCSDSKVSSIVRTFEDAKLLLTAYEQIIITGLGAGGTTPAPAVVTQTATSITPFGTTLTGTANPRGFATTAYFEWGLTPSYGNQTTSQAMGSGSTATAVGGGGITGLACETIYHFRVVASSSGGVANGSDATFTTSACPASAPDAVTGVADTITQTTAILRGTVDPNGATTIAVFAYGTSATYGSLTTEQDMGSGTTAVAVGGGSISGLTCNTVYHFRVVATNSVSTSVGSDATFTTSACPIAAPTVTTGSAASVTATTATLQGTANPNSASTTGLFQYGVSTAYGSSTAPASLGSGAMAVSITGGAITGLTCNTLYHFRAQATNSGGTANGADNTFTTASCPIAAPTVVTDAASLVTQTTARLNGTVNPNSASTTAYFELGTSTAYDTRTPDISSGSGGSPVATTADLSSLTCNTLYHARLRATNSGGTGFGSDVTLTTSACPLLAPTVVTGSAGSIGQTSATLQGTANPNAVPTSANFVWGTTTGYGNTTLVQDMGAGSMAAAVGGGAITGLVCNTLYHFRVTATSGGGTSNGADNTFTTSACPVAAPTVVTGAASSVTQTTATLNGTVNPNSASTTSVFQWGMSTSYGTTSTPVSAGSGATPVAASTNLTGLTCNTTYQFRIQATNAGGTSNGANASFTTSACPILAPTVVTGSAASITTTTATLQGTATPNGTTTTGSFQYGLSTGYGSSTTPASLGAGSSPVAITGGALTGLACATLYNFRATATNAGGTTTGANATFTTSACPVQTPPTVVTSPVSAVGQTSVTFNGTANPNGSATSGFVRYGLTTGYGSQTTAQNFGSGSSVVAFSGHTATGLTCGTTYFFRLQATNTGGTTLGTGSSVTTASCTSVPGTVYTLDDFTGGNRIVQPAETNPRFRFLWNENNNLSGSASASTVAITATSPPPGFTASIKDTFTQTLLAEGGVTQFQFYPYTIGTLGLSPDGWQYMRSLTDGSPAWTIGQVNRMRFWVKVPSNTPQPSTAGNSNFQFGTYLRELGDSFTTAESNNWHFYHLFNFFGTGEWEQVIIDTHPSYQRAGPPNNDIGNKAFPSTVTPTYTYFDLMTRFYLDSGYTVFPSNPNDISFGGFEPYVETYPEAINEVYAVHAVYVPGTNTLRLGWNRNKDDCSTVHEVRYAFTDIHVSGWNAATAAPGGSITPPNCGGYNMMAWSSSAITVTGQTQIYLAIRPVGSTLFTQIRLPLP